MLKLEKWSGRKENFTRIDCNSYGNPRIVYHFPQIIPNEREAFSSLARASGTLYWLAQEKASYFGGRKYHNKQFGGGIVFNACGAEDMPDILQDDEYNLRQAERLALVLLNDAEWLADHPASPYAFNGGQAFARLCADEAKKEARTNKRYKGEKITKYQWILAGCVMANRILYRHYEKV